MIKQFELEPGTLSHRIEHGLGSTALLINAWQNDHTVSPSVRIIDENVVEVYNMVGGGSLVIGAADPKAPKVTPKTSTRSKKTSGEEAKRSGSTTRGASSKGSSAKRGS